MRNRRNLLLVIEIGLFILAPLSDGWSWDVTPKATELDKMIKEFRSIRFWSFWGDEIADFIVDRFSSPVHEAITDSIYGCDHGFKFCSSTPSP